MKVFKSWFFESLTGSSGDRFNTGNKPTKDTFKNLVDSTLNPLEVEDTAKTSSAGHVMATSDTDAYNRGSGLSSAHTRVVQPHQLPNIEAEDGTEIVTKDLEVTKGGLMFTAIEKTIGTLKRKNFRIKVKTANSVVVTSEAINLVNDEDNPVDNSVYAKTSAKKGWITFISLIQAYFPTWLWSGGTVKRLVSNGVTVSWIPDTTGGASGYEPDNESIALNTYSRLKLKYLTTLIGGQGSQYAPSLGFTSNGVHVKVDQQTITYNTGGYLKTNSGVIPDDRVCFGDDFLDSSLSGRWEENNTTIDATDVNGLIALQTSTLPDEAHINEAIEVDYAKNPIMKVRFRLDLAVGITANSPDIYVGIIGDGSTVTLGDFVGFTMNKTSGYWRALVKIDGVEQSSTTTGTLVDDVWVTMEVQLKTDMSAILKINEEAEISIPAGTCNFDSVQNNAIHLINVISESNAIIVDYINVMRDRDTSLPT